MTLSPALRAAIDDVSFDVWRTHRTFVVTQAQYDDLRNEANRSDVVDQPFARRIVPTASLFHVPVVVREIGADISDLDTPYDLRSIA